MVHCHRCDPRPQSGPRRRAILRITPRIIAIGRVMTYAGCPAGKVASAPELAAETASRSSRSPRGLGEPD